MRAQLENEYINLYNDQNEIVGKIGINQQADYTENEIIVNDTSYKIIREGWAFKVYEKDEVIYNLKTNPFFGYITVLELNKRIKGIFSLKWGTQLVDEDNNTLLKIRNESQLVNNGSYIINIEDKNIRSFEILLSLFGHIYGSSLKTRSVVV